MGPLEGFRVVDLGAWVVGPSAAAVLADWGADIVKIESPDGDPSRAWTTSVNPWFELDNRGKRSITLDLKNPAGARVAHELIARADVFVTNLRPSALRALGLDYETLETSCPRLVYLSITGFGLEGPDRDKAAYDAGAFWSRSGAVMTMTPEGSDFPTLPGGSGDHVTAITGVAGAVAALVARERTGRGQHVTTSLLRSGMFMISSDLIRAVRLGDVMPPPRHADAANPLYNWYRTADDKWIFLLGLQPHRHLSGLGRAIGRTDLVDDPRFATATALTEHHGELVAILDGVFATRTLDEWSPVLDDEDVWWTPVRSPMDLVSDPQAIAAGAWVDSPVAGGRATTIASPVDFLGTPWSVDRTPPGMGEHNQEIVESLGYTPDDIAQLAIDGAFG